MRDLLKNQKHLYFVNQTSTELVEDGYEDAPVYEDTPHELWANVSGGRGRARYEPFGQFTDYTKTVSVSDTDCPLRVFARVWLGVPTTDPFNYTVVQEHRGLDSVLYALKEVPR